MYATCERCELPMRPGGACTPHPDALPWGVEIGMMTGEYLTDLQYCHDCNVAPYEWHHKGCSVEIDYNGEQTL